MHINRNKLSLLAWTLFAIVTVGAAIGLADTLANRPADDNLVRILSDLVWGTLGVLFAFVAALIINRQPRNVIGWLMIIPPIAFLIDFIGRSYLEQFPDPSSLPSAQLMVAALLELDLWLLLIFPLLFIMLLFPNGRPPSPRWRWITIFGLALIGSFAFLSLFLPTFNLTELYNWEVTNPIGFLPPEAESLIYPWQAGLATLTILCAAAPFVHYRRSSGVEQAQIKWLFYACGLFALVYLPNFILSEREGLLFDAWDLLLGLAIMAFPTAIVIAITRYRLYEINVIIRKTLIYTAMTFLLAAIYFGSVLLLQSLFEAISGQRSHLIIVLSTLIIAALSAPLHRRLQSTIDRRFFRQKYNAQQVLAQFTQTARDEVELEALTAALAQVTSDTVHPESVSVWLRDRHP